MKIKNHITNDIFLNALVNFKGVIGEYVAVFPGKVNITQNPDWLDSWFLGRVNYFLGHPELQKTTQIDAKSLLVGIINEQAYVVKKPAAILSIWPHFFRGFRNPANPLNLNGRLIVLDGRNSSGKTSLAEAFEWLLTGQLSRRYHKDMGDAEELENCITNQLRPMGENTWVEAVFSSQGEKINVRRVLLVDYCNEKNSLAKSELYVNGTKLEKQEEGLFLDELTAGVPPVLMQHSLRTFVLSTPRERRDYFERLLRLDELADLIEKSVIGKARLVEFPSPQGSLAFKGWENFISSLTMFGTRSLRQVEQSTSNEIKGNLAETLLIAAKNAFKITDTVNDLEEAKREIESIQQKKRSTSFPLLDSLRPIKTIDPQLLLQFKHMLLPEELANFEKSYNNFIDAMQQANKVGEAQIVIAEAYEKLAQLGLIQKKPEDQSCPMCEAKPDTLTQKRITFITSWQPIQKAKQKTETQYRSVVDSLISKMQDLVSSRNGILPEQPTEMEWSSAVGTTTNVIQNAAGSFRKSSQECFKVVLKFDKLTAVLKNELLNDLPVHDIPKIKELIGDIEKVLGLVIEKAREYQTSFTLLDSAVGTQAREDPDYNLRELWLSLVNNLDGLCSDFLWEQAKKRAQEELENIRQFLVDSRDAIIASRRQNLSEGMANIWSRLRSDRYSAFSGLNIPPPRGKGLPLEIKVKALLDDATQQKEVDALRVFSESQINILGIAAFTTRSKLLGHKLIILDDPVQSMDEDHFKTFANQLLPELLGQDGQVIVLTHNDMFARELSYAWADKEPDFFITMSIDHIRKVGCVIQEGNRRVFERLKQAEDFSDKGDLINAWISVRKAIERFYTLVRVKYGEPGFDHYSWRNSTGEDMLKQGVSNILLKNAVEPSSVSEILKMTAAAAHDKKPYGETDLQNSIKMLRGLASKLHIDC